MKNTFYFIGTISDKTSNYQVQEIKLKNGVEFSIYLDGLGIKYTTDITFDETKAILKNTFDIIISAVAFLTDKPLNFGFQNWVEARETEVNADTIGWFYSPLSLPPQARSRRSKINSPWKKAAYFFNSNHSGNGNQNHVLALKDFRSALNDISYDSILFAYRSVEDVCRAVTGIDDTNDKKTWNTMHDNLGTNFNQLKELTDVAKKIRHGQINDALITESLSKRSLYLTDAKNILTKEFKHVYPKFI